MSRRTFCLFSGLVLQAGFACGTETFAQSITCPAADEQQDQRPEIKVIIDQVEFQGDNPLPESVRAGLVKQIQQHTYNMHSGDPEELWFAEVLGVTIRTALLDDGYFQASPTGTTYLIRALQNELHYAVRIELGSGRQYRLAAVAITNSEDKPLAINESLIRQQLELQTGELFNASKIRSALKNIEKLYQSKGYLDAVPDPVSEINEKNGRIDLAIKIDDGPQYRISGIDVRGAGTRQVALPQAPGDLPDPALWWKFFQENQSRFVEGAEFESSIRMGRDTRASTVRVTVDFQACPNREPLHDPGVTLRTKFQAPRVSIDGLPVANSH
jgi:hypothetical protein